MAQDVGFSFKRIESDADVLSCEACGHRAPRKRDLEKHIQLVHNPTFTKNIKCKNCKKFYKTARTLRRHICMKN